MYENRFIVTAKQGLMKGTKIIDKETGTGKLVTTGVYRFIRHPQYTGLLLLSLGILIEWATLPMLIMFPVMVFMYIRACKARRKRYAP